MSNINDPVGYVSESGLTNLINGNGVIVGDKTELRTIPLFAHAMPKSEEADASDIERLQINSDLLDDVLNWLRERDLYHDADYFSEGPDLAAILSAHEDELLRPWPATPQPSTDVSELVAALKPFADAANVPVMDSGSPNTMVRVSKEQWHAARALIAKHTVNANDENKTSA